VPGHRPLIECTGPRRLAGRDTAGQVGFHVAGPAVGDGSEWVGQHQAEQPVWVVHRPDRLVHGQVPAPGVADHIGTLGAGRVQDSDRIRDMLLDIERSRCNGGRQSTLLVADNAEGVLELGGQWECVIRQARAAVQQENSWPSADLPSGDASPGHLGLRLDELGDDFDRKLGCCRASPRSGSVLV
jgi:hypothetical protein